MNSDYNPSLFLTETKVFTALSFEVHAATDPRRNLCSLRAVVLLLLASCVFLVFSGRAVADVLVCLVGSFLLGFLAAEGRV